MDGPRERKVDSTKLRRFILDILQLCDMSIEEREILADTLVAADLRGMRSHGCLRLPIYVEKIRAGGFRAGRKGRVERETDSIVLLDGEDGVGQVLAVRAMDEAMRKARGRGIGAAGVTRSNHYGEAAYYVLHAVRNNMIGMIMTNGSPNMPPWGGTTKMTGPLPFTVGVPTSNEHPFILDAALGMTNKGKLIYLAEQGLPIPPGWGVDNLGRPTENPQHVLDGGWILPIGGHKGFGITMFLEILAGVLTGGAIGSEIRDLYDVDRAKPQGVGHFAIAIDPAAFMPLDQFKQRMDYMIRMMKSSKPAPGTEVIKIPGEIEFDNEERHRREGVPISDTVLGQLNRLSHDVGSNLTL